MYDFLLDRHCNYSSILYHFRVIKPQLATARLRLHASMMSICLSVCPSVCLSVCLSVANMQKTRFSQKLSNLELRCLLTIGSRTWAFQRTHYWIPTIQDCWDTPSWKSTWRHFFCRGWSDLDKISQTGTEWHVDCDDVWKWKPDVKFRYGARLGEFNGMSSQSHVSHCRVLPLGEFTVTSPEPHATLQGAVT